MAKKFDFNKIKDEIANEKQSRNMVSSRLGESVGKGVAPRDEFLNGLLTSLKTGRETAASTLIKVVENKVADKHGEVKKHVINETPVQRQTTRETIDMSPERDEELFRDLENKRKQTLSESMESFSNKTSSKPTGNSVDFNGQQFLTSKPYVQQSNDNVLNENVKAVVNNYLTENLGPIFEEAIKGTIIEMYAIERIQAVLNENRDLIKSIVVDTIREIQAKNKAKAQ